MDMSHVKQYTVMKRFIVLALMLPLWTVLGAGKNDDCITKDGYFRGIRLCGRVKVVEHAADFDVRVVDSGADLDVRAVRKYASNPSEWQFVNSAADFTIRFVEHAPDFDIKFVERYPEVRSPCAN